MQLNIIVAMDMNNEIGKNGSLPWDAPAEMAYFTKHTLGCTLIMGRKTHESIMETNGGPLRSRKSIVVSGKYKEIYGATLVVETPFAALTHVPSIGTAWVIGGGQIYRDLMPLCDNLFVTVIRQEYDCDTFFPDINLKMWRKDRVSKRLSDENNPTMCFRVYRNMIKEKNSK